MKTIGKYLSEHRQKIGISLEDLATQTKIRVDYLEAIEADNYTILPSAAFVKGFIRSYSLAVRIDPDKAMAIFRRDYDHNQTGKVIPRGLSQPVHHKRSFWAPRTTTIAIFLFLMLIVAGYVANQVRTLVSAPEINLFEPKEAEVFNTANVHVSGNTATDAVVRVNNQTLILDQEGDFEVSLDLPNGEHTILIEAESREGQIRRLSRTVLVQTE